MPGDPAMGDAVRGLAGKRSAVLLANHGPVVAGKELEATVYAMEELEEGAKLALMTRGMEADFSELSMKEEEQLMINDIVDLQKHPIDDAAFGADCNATLDRDGVLVLADFIQPTALATMLADSKATQDDAYFCAQDQPPSCFVERVHLR